MTLFLDAAGTLIHPSEPVGAVYAGHLHSVAGIAVDPERMHTAFRDHFASARPPLYPPQPTGHAVEFAWWREFVASVLHSLGGAPAEFAATSPPDSPALPSPHASASPGATFHTYFEALFTHFSSPAAWSLFPEVPEFLDSASRLGPIAVVSNFDDRLAPILDGLGIGPSFEHIITSADARARKPDPAIFALALDRLNSAPAETAHCGDSHQADFVGATAAGLRAFHLRRPAHTLLDFLTFCRS